MDNKIMAIIIVSILAVASVSVFAITKMSDKDDSTEKTACDTWYANFNEYVVFDDAAENMEVINHHFLISEEKVPLIIDSVDNNLIKGKWGEKAFVGSIHGHFFFFTCESYPFAKEPFSCYVEGRIIDDRILLNASIYAEGEQSIAGAGYVQYTRQNTVPTDLYIDKVKFPTEYTPQSRSVFNLDAKGDIQKVLPDRDIPTMEHVTSGVMIHVVKVKLNTSGTEPSLADILVFVSQGHDREGCGLTYLCGRLSFEGGVHYYSGSAVLSKDKLKFSYELDLENENQYVGFFTYGVDYKKGEPKDINITAGEQKVTLSLTSNGKTDKKECTVTIKTLENCMTMVVKDSDGKTILSFLGINSWHEIHGVSSQPDLGFYMGFYNKDEHMFVHGAYLIDGKQVLFNFELKF